MTPFAPLFEFMSNRGMTPLQALGILMYKHLVPAQMSPAAYAAHTEPSKIDTVK